MQKPSSCVSVDWGELAKQWIALKEQGDTPGVVSDSSQNGHESLPSQGQHQILSLLCGCRIKFLDDETKFHPRDSSDLFVPSLDASFGDAQAQGWGWGETADQPAKTSDTWGGIPAANWAAAPPPPPPEPQLVCAFDFDAERFSELTVHNSVELSIL